MVVTAFVAGPAQPASASTAAAVSAGADHTCALTTAGGLKCWGGNFYGHLGDGTATNRTTPVDVTGLTSGVAAVSAGASHTCALTTAGGLKCMGSNNYGQLGDETVPWFRTTPMDVAGLTSGVAAVSAGAWHTCALSTVGGVKCWGRNNVGRLGDGTTTQRLTPVDVIGLTSGVSAVSVGGAHTCAVTTAGGVKCWGSNSLGRLGDGTQTDRTPAGAASWSTPVDVTGLTSGVAAVSAGSYHTCAVTTAGGLKCWGDNYSGRLGDGTATDRTTPVDVTGLTSGVAAVSTMFAHTCAVTTAGDVKCWGSNFYGQLGDGTTPLRTTPVDVTGLTSGVAAVSTGGLHTCALTTLGALKCWGFNSYGQLGDGTSGNVRTTPVDVTGLTTEIAAVSAGADHTCALTTAGGLKCWGGNFYGHLGDGTATNRTTPVDVTDLTSGVAAVSSGASRTCALTTAGGLKCMGSNNYGQLGDETVPWFRTTPMDVAGLTSGVAAVSAGGDQTCAVTTAGGLKCWGYNFYGQLGDGTTTTRTTPVDVVGLTSAVAGVSAGSEHTCAVTTEGGLKCWGRNDTGQLGDGTFTTRTTPVDVIGLTSGVAAVFAGSRHTCALTTAGGLKCWGSNQTGQLGDETLPPFRTRPVDVVGFAVTATPVPTEPPTDTPTSTPAPEEARPSVYSGSVVVAGGTVPKGAVVVARVGDYESFPAVIGDDETYRNLVVDPGRFRADREDGRVLPERRKVQDHGHLPEQWQHKGLRPCLLRRADTNAAGNSNACAFHGDACASDGDACASDGYARATDGDACASDGHARATDGNACASDGHARASDGHTRAPDGHASAATNGHACASDGHASAATNGHDRAPDGHASAATNGHDRASGGHAGAHRRRVCSDTQCACGSRAPQFPSAASPRGHDRSDQTIQETLWPSPLMPPRRDRAFLARSPTLAPWIALMDAPRLELVSGLLAGGARVYPLR